MERVGVVIRIRTSGFYVGDVSWTYRSLCFDFCLILLRDSGFYLNGSIYLTTLKLDRA